MLRGGAAGSARAAPPACLGRSASRWDGNPRAESVERSFDVLEWSGGLAPCGRWNGRGEAFGGTFDVRLYQRGRRHVAPLLDGGVGRGVEGRRVSPPGRGLVVTLGLVEATASVGRRAGDVHVKQSGDSGGPRGGGVARVDRPAPRKVPDTRSARANEQAAAVRSGRALLARLTTAFLLCPGADAFVDAVLARWRMVRLSAEADGRVEQARTGRQAP